MARNWMKIPVSFFLWREMMTTGNVMMARVEEGIPPGAAYVRSWHDTERDTVYFVFEHPSFGEVPEGSIIPVLDVSWADIGHKSIRDLICPNE